jgi:lysophospholipase L1-like esterase
VSELPGLEGSEGSVLCLGDSVTAGVGLGKGQSWPERLGRSLRRQRVEVARHAAPGARIAWAAEEGVPLVQQLPPGSIVLVMLGHNDQVRFEPGAGQRLRRHQFEDLGQSTSGWRGPRIWRLLRWASHDERPAMAGIQHLRAAFEQALDPLVEATEARDAQLWLMTYLIPGAPPESLPRDEASILEDVQAGQATVNALIRAEAGRRGLGLIDLEAIVPVGAEWNTEQWLDHIHPSATLTVEIAEAVEATLLRE